MKTCSYLVPVLTVSQAWPPHFPYTDSFHPHSSPMGSAIKYHLTVDEIEAKWKSLPKATQLVGGHLNHCVP